MKIAILGYSGSGKSTLARKLGEKLGCPVLHLDQVQFTSGWVERDRGEAVALVEAFLERDQWVIEGNYSEFALERRLREADRIFLLELNRWTCLIRAVRRVARFRGQTRPDMAPGCPERWDWEFLRWVVWDGRSAQRRRQYRQIAAQYPEKTTMFRRAGEIEKAVEEIVC